MFLIIGALGDARIHVVQVSALSSIGILYLAHQHSPEKKIHT